LDETLQYLEGALPSTSVSSG